MRSRFGGHGHVLAAFIVGVVVASAATAGAASLITGKQIKDGTITKKDLAKALQRQLAKTGAAGVAGPVGPPGVKGDAGAPGAQGSQGVQAPPGPATGPAGGDLTGSYPDPAIGAGKVTAAKLGDGSVTSSKFADGAKAPDADLLDGLDSTEVGLGFFTGRVNNLPTGFGHGSGAPSGLTVTPGTSNFTTDPQTTLSPNRPIVLRDLSVRLTAPAAGMFGPGRSVSLAAVEPLNTLVTLGCTISSGQSACTAAGPSAVVPANTPLVFVVSNMSMDSQPAADALFSWRAAAAP